MSKQRNWTKIENGMINWIRRTGDKFEMLITWRGTHEVIKRRTAYRKSNVNGMVWTPEKHIYTSEQVKFAEKLVEVPAHLAQIIANKWGFDYLQKTDNGWILDNPAQFAEVK